MLIAHYIKSPFSVLISGIDSHCQEVGPIVAITLETIALELSLDLYLYLTISLDPRSIPRNRT